MCQVRAGPPSVPPPRTSLPGKAWLLGTDEIIRQGPGSSAPTGRTPRSEAEPGPERPGASFRLGRVGLDGEPRIAGGTLVFGPHADAPFDPPADLLALRPGRAVFEAEGQGSGPGDGIHDRESRLDRQFSAPAGRGSAGRTPGRPRSPGANPGASGPVDDGPCASPFAGRTAERSCRYRWPSHRSMPCFATYPASGRRSSKESRMRGDPTQRSASASRRSIPMCARSASTHLEREPHGWLL